MKVQCLIIDDEQPARELLKAYLNKVPHLQLAGEFKNPIDAIGMLNSRKIDLIFLDIQMPGLTGLDFIKTLTTKPAIILTTAYSQYALEGYELDVLDYLMKPISFERFLKAVNKIPQAPAPGIPVTTPENESKFMIIKADGQKHKVIINDILYIEGLKEYVTFHLIDRKIITLESLRNLEETLPENHFIRVHKSYIVNKEKVKSYSGTDLFIGDKKIPIGQSYRKVVGKNLF